MNSGWAADETLRENGNRGLVPDVEIFQLLLECMKYVGVSTSNFPEADGAQWQAFFEEAHFLWSHRQSSLDMKRHVDQDDDESGIVLAEDPDAERWLHHAQLWKWYAVKLVAQSVEAERDPLLVWLYLVFANEFIDSHTAECCAVSGLELHELTRYLLENFPRNTPQGSQEERFSATTLARLRELHELVE
jgi:hypothetical protein